MPNLYTSRLKNMAVV